jgi:hypothetical protein
LNQKLIFNPDICFKDFHETKQNITGSLLDFGVARLGVGLCPKCLQDAPQMANRTVVASDIAARLDALSAAEVREIDVFNLDSNRGGATDHFHQPPWGVNSTQAALWWDAIRSWKKAGQRRAKTDDGGYSQPAAPRSNNPFGIGAYYPPGDSQIELAAELVGAGGWVLILVPAGNVTAETQLPPTCPGYSPAEEVSSQAICRRLRFMGQF